MGIEIPESIIWSFLGFISTQAFVGVIALIKMWKDVMLIKTVISIQEEEKDKEIEEIKEYIKELRADVKDLFKDKEGSN